MTKIALLNIGTELLRGRTVNTNAATAGQILIAAGYTLETTVAIHDHGPTIAAHIRDLMAAHDVVLITGGLGPTKDDITKKVLQEIFGGEMVCHAPTLRRIEGFLARQNRPLLEHNRQQAFVPATCEVLDNERGTAPCMAFPQGSKRVISMPGVPFEMEYLMREKVVPYLQGTFAPAVFLARVVRTAGIPESRIAERMETIEAQLDPRIEIAYLPGYDGTKIELKLQGPAAEAAQAEEALASAQQAVASLFERYVYALEDKTPDKLLAEYLLRTKKTFGTAESCTGGAIVAQMVEHNGISTVLRGGLVAYMREVKEQVLGVPPSVIDTYGIVSAQVAEAMALGAQKLLGCDLAVGITGLAGPVEKDAPDSEQPQAWIGFADSHGTRSIHIRLFQDRKVNIRIAVQAALIFVLRSLPANDGRN